MTTIESLAAHYREACERADKLEHAYRDAQRTERYAAARCACHLAELAESKFRLAQGARDQVRDALAKWEDAKVADAAAYRAWVEACEDRRFWAQKAMEVTGGVR